MPAFLPESSLTPYTDVYPFVDPAQFKGKLTGQVVLITGAGRGIGREAAIAFASTGASVALVARRAHDLDAVADLIRQRFDTPLLPIPADVTDFENQSRIITETQKNLGPIDVLVNNAGMTRFNVVEEEPADMRDWWKVMELNVRAPVMLARAVLPEMLQRQRGTIINVASISGAADVDYQSAYATSKAAIIKFTQGLNTEVQERGIKCISMHPGTCATDMGSVEGAMNMDAFSKFPGMGEMAKDFQTYEYQQPRLPASVMVWLAAANDSKLLSGKFVDSQHDLEKVIEDLKRGQDSRVVKERLYRLRVTEL